jgi:putative ABC transport system permease protein
MRKDLIKYVMQHIMKRLTRSSLTILSILIGIMAIYALVSFGQGLQKYIGDVAQEMGTDKLMVQPRGFSAPGTSSTPLTKDDLDFISKINGVAEIGGVVMSSAEIKIDERQAGKYVYATGMPSGPEQRMLEQTFQIEVDKGRGLQKGDNNIVVLGYNYQIAKKIFEKPVELGQKVIINGAQFKVIGFYKELGNPSDDSNIYMTMDDAGDLFGSKDEYGYIIIRADQSENPTELAAAITDKLRRHKGQKEGMEDFYVQTFEQAIASFTTIVNVLNAILVLIALISVVVAAVNIANTMYTAVLERTKEIGVMKAIGAQNSTILSIFVIESGALGLIGGAIGILVGYLIAKAGGAIAAAYGYSMLQPYFPWWLTLGCLVFATLVGIVSGYLPARAASKLNPVEALRYE